MECSITKDKGEALTNEKIVAPSYLFFYSLFQQCDIQLNDTSVTSTTNSYADRSIFETLLNYGSDAQLSHLTSSLFYKDTASKMDSFTLQGNDVNEGFTRRKTIASITFDMYGRSFSEYTRKFQKRRALVSTSLCL